MSPGDNPTQRGRSVSKMHTAVFLLSVLASGCVGDGGDFSDQGQVSFAWTLKDRDLPVVILPCAAGESMHITAGASSTIHPCEATDAVSALLDRGSYTARLALLDSSDVEIAVATQEVNVFAGGGVNPALPVTLLLPGGEMPLTWATLDAAAGCGASGSVVIVSDGLNLGVADAREVPCSAPGETIHLPRGRYRVTATLWNGPTEVRSVTVEVLVPTGGSAPTTDLPLGAP